MTNDIISKKTRCEFREYLVGWALREIQKLFDAEDIECVDDYNPPESGQRRSLVEKYYRSLNFTCWDDVSKLLRVYSEILSNIEDILEDDAPFSYGIDNKNTLKKTLKTLILCIQRDGFVYENKKISQNLEAPSFQCLKTTIAKLDYDYLQGQIKRMEESVNSDTSLAIGTAKELVETCCKTILKEKNIEADKDWDICKLTKETFKLLELAPENIEDGKRVSDSAKQILRSLSSIVQGMAELRNIFGTGHGKHGRFKGLPPRYAKLATGASASLATFLFETYFDREKITKN